MDGKPTNVSLFDSTSRLAGEKAALAVGSRRRRIIELLQEKPRAIFEVAEALECFDHQISGRFGELERDLIIEKTGERRRKESTGCDAEVYRIRTQPAPPADLGQQLNYPPTLIIDDSPFERQAICERVPPPGIEYVRVAALGGVRQSYRVEIIECGGCGRPLKCVDEPGHNGARKRSFRCGTVGCNRTWYLELVKEPGATPVLALVMRHL